MLQYLEYGFYDFDVNEKETKSQINKAVQLYPNTISVLPQYIRAINKTVPTNIDLSTVIDYPYGLSSFYARKESLMVAIDNGVDAVEIICPNYLLCNRKYSNFKDEISQFKEICIKNKVHLKYVLQYKIYTLNILYKIIDMLSTQSIVYIYPSIGLHLDSITDNILAAMLLQNKYPKMKIIVTGQAWTNEHADLILSNNQIFGYKTNSLYTLEKIQNKML